MSIGWKNIIFIHQGVDRIREDCRGTSAKEAGTEEDGTINGDELVISLLLDGKWE